MTPKETHNKHAPRIMTEIVKLCDQDIAQINVMIETLLLGAATFNFPHDHRRQAMIIQEIADAATDRVARKTADAP